MKTTLIKGTNKAKKEEKRIRKEKINRIASYTNFKDQQAQQRKYRPAIKSKKKQSQSFNDGHQSVKKRKKTVVLWKMVAIEATSRNTVEESYRTNVKKLARETISQPKRF